MSLSSWPDGWRKRDREVQAHWKGRSETVGIQLSAIAISIEFLRDSLGRTQPSIKQVGGDRSQSVRTRTYRSTGSPLAELPRFCYPRFSNRITHLSNSAHWYKKVCQRGFRLVAFADTLETSATLDYTSHIRIRHLKQNRPRTVSCTFYPTIRSTQSTYELGSATFISLSLSLS